MGADLIFNSKKQKSLEKSRLKHWYARNIPNHSELAEKLRDSAQNNAEEFIDNLTALAPNEAPVIQAIETDNSGLFSMLNSHLRNAARVPLYRTNQSNASYRQQRPYSRPYYDNHSYYQPPYAGQGYTYGLASGDLINPASMWLNAYKGKSKFEKSDNRQSFESDKQGVIAALEKQFARSFTAGVGYAFEQNKVKSLQRDTDVDSYKMFAYAEIRPNDFFINEAVSYTLSKYKEKADIFDQTANASYDVRTLATQTTVGYQGRCFTPQIGVRTYLMKREEYTDGSNQQIASNDIRLVRGVAGIRAGADIYNDYRRVMRPELYVGLTYDFSSDADEAVVTLPNGETYTLHGQTLNKFGLETSVSFTADFTERFSLSAQYLGDYRDKYNAHTGLVGMKYKF
ncbi:MAG: autotransporter outer membrane beta-barrel domain-containing protein [Alphaproteobacteria bacterium]|nr:autotransporter outer membrane beta-barrel domain-containing protein [Alphaproteobacteria bacterium]